MEKNWSHNINKVSVFFFNFVATYTPTIRSIDLVIYGLILILYLI